LCFVVTPTTENDDGLCIFRDLSEELHGAGRSRVALRGQRVERFLGTRRRRRRRRMRMRRRG
jgi:hypothetical protein